MKLKHSITAIFLLLCSNLAAVDIEGNYSISGFDPYFGSSYTGTAIVFEDGNDVYQFRWYYDQNGRLYECRGTGIRVGDVISIVFRDLPSQDNLIIEEGVQLYTIKSNTLEGSFVLLDKNLVGNEKLTKK
jgi:hypothetical protein